MRIDAHQHFWHYNDHEYGWMGPDMDALKKDHLPIALSPLLKALGFDGSIAVQARQTLDETRWLLELAQQHDFIKGVVGWVDLQSEGVAEQLEEFSSSERFVGVRHVIEDESNPAFCLNSDFVRGVQTLADYGLTYDLLVRPHQLAAAAELVARCPEQPFVLDHIAKPSIATGEIDNWESGLRRLATSPSVYCKLSGMVTEADWHSWQPSDLVPYMEIVFDAFGPDRLMIGSDWPVCTVTGDYAQVMKVVIDFATSKGAAAAGIHGDNAARFYGISNTLS